jgi:hypothetical protein
MTDYLISNDDLEYLRQVSMDYNEGYDNVRDDYSGRFMFGASCIGIDLDYSFDFENILDRVSMINETMADEMKKRATWDSMGLGKIVYFPGMKLELSDED